MDTTQLTITCILIAVVLVLVTNWYNKRSIKKESNEFFTQVKEYASGQKKIKITCPKPSFKFARGEQVLFASEASRIEYKSNGRSSYHGPRFRIRIAKGLYYTGGSNSTRVSKSWQATDHGYIYITDRRIIFDGNQRNSSLRLNKIPKFNYDLQNRTFTFEKDTGNPLILRVVDFTPVAAAIAFLAVNETDKIVSHGDEQQQDINIVAVVG